MKKQILDELRRQMNGAVSQSMRELGHSESLNLGVSLPTIKAIAMPYAPNHALAEELSSLSSREAHIAALYLADPVKLTTAQADLWSSTWQTHEIARLSAMLLICKSPIAAQIAARWLEEESKTSTSYTASVESTQKLRKVAALYIIGKIAATADNSIIDAVIFSTLEEVANSSIVDDQNTGTVFALREIYAARPEYRPQIMDIAESIDDLKWQLEPRTLGREFYL